MSYKVKAKGIRLHDKTNVFTGSFKTVDQAIEWSRKQDLEHTSIWYIDEKGEEHYQEYSIDCRIEKDSMSLFLFTPLTSKASEWIKANISEESSYFGESLVVETRYAYDLANGMLKDGLNLI